jgi:hypothetical protein
MISSSPRRTTSAKLISFSTANLLASRKRASGIWTCVFTMMAIYPLIVCRSTHMLSQHGGVGGRETSACLLDQLQQPFGNLGIYLNPILQILKCPLSKFQAYVSNLPWFQKPSALESWRQFPPIVQHSKPHRESDPAALRDWMPNRPLVLFVLFLGSIGRWLTQRRTLV